jgi:aspartate ammonia-lyase
MEPVIAQSILESMAILQNGMRTLRERCVEGITANAERCRSMVERSIGIVTALNPVLGYETATELAREAARSNRGVYDLVLEKGLLSRAELDALLSPEGMLKPRKIRSRRDAERSV